MRKPLPFSSKQSLPTLAPLHSGNSLGIYNLPKAFWSQRNGAQKEIGIQGVRHLDPEFVHDRCCLCRTGHCRPTYPSVGNLDTRAIKSHIEEIDFRGLSQVDTVPGRKQVSRGTYPFCSDAYSVDNLGARVGFNFYGDAYGPDYPPPCD